MPIVILIVASITYIVACLALGFVGIIIIFRSIRYMCRMLKAMNQSDPEDRHPFYRR